jgi:hypothetical protein
MKVNAHGKDVSIDESGTAIKMEEEVSLDSIPAAAQAVIEKCYGSAKMRHLTEVS